MKRLEISAFKIWFYKNDLNNQIYVLNLTNLSFKGVSCQLYDNFFIVEDDENALKAPVSADQESNSSTKR